MFCIALRFLAEPSIAVMKWIDKAALRQRYRVTVPAASKLESRLSAPYLQAVKRLLCPSRPR